MGSEGKGTIQHSLRIMVGIADTHAGDDGTSMTEVNAFIEALNGDSKTLTREQSSGTW